MKLQIRSPYISADVAGALRQMEESISIHVVEQASNHPQFQNIAQLLIWPICAHPFSQRAANTRRSFDALSGSYYVSPHIDYISFASLDWLTRVSAYSASLVLGVSKVAKTRILPEQRETLIDIIEQACVEIGTAPPAHIVEVDPVYVPMDKFDGSAGLGYSPSPGMKPIFPKDIPIHIIPQPLLKERLFKLYTNISGKLCYREAWFDDDLTVISHSGICGHRGEVQSYTNISQNEAHKTFQRLKNAALDEGFKSISISRHAKLVVEIPVAGSGTRAGLDTRHALEDFLNDLTGWLGLGHLDGGSSGLGTMEAMCYVVNFAIAKQAIRDALRQSQFSNFSKIYHELS